MSKYIELLGREEAKEPKETRLLLIVTCQLQIKLYKQSQLNTKKNKPCVLSCHY